MANLLPKIGIVMTLNSYYTFPFTALFEIQQTVGLSQQLQLQQSLAQYLTDFQRDMKIR